MDDQPDLPDLPVVMLSHRGPVSFRKGESGWLARRAAGGLVTALMGLAEHLEDAVWVCAASTTADAQVSAEHDGQAVEIAFAPTPHLVEQDHNDDEPSLSVRYVEVDRAAHADFYGRISNPLLWFIQHGLYGLSTEPDITPEIHHAWEHGYVAVNRQFADAVIEEIESRGGKCIVLLQDYHFYLVGQMIRERCPDAIVSHFVHIPWPSADAWRTLPPNMRDQILTGLLGCDVVAFHTGRFARNFVSAAEELLDLGVDRAANSVAVGPRMVCARTYPISVDVASIEAISRRQGVTEVKQAITDAHLSDGRQLIVRVDRTDPSKNIVRGFRAFSHLLEAHPELRGRVTFLASLQPSRQDVKEYADYLSQVGGIVAEVNAKWQSDGWQPIDLRLQEDLEFAVAAYQLADVLVVNAVSDGMNLVAKEAVLVNERSGVLVLSENTGAHEELGAFALTVNPFDIGQQADAMFEALTMPRERRQGLLDGAAAVVRSNDISRWLRTQLIDLTEVAGL